MGSKRQRLEQTIAAIQHLHGERAVRVGARPRAVDVPHVPTGFARLDALTGCGGVPIGALTLISGKSTSGKATLAYKTLANAQRAMPGGLAALLDLHGAADADYLARCGVDLGRLVLSQPKPARQAVELLIELARQARKHRLAAVLIDDLGPVVADAAASRALGAAAPQLALVLQHAGCAMIALAEARPVWQRWVGGGALGHNADLHIELSRETWLERDGELVGYRARAAVARSRWAPAGRAAPLEIEFNGTVKARNTW